ncbi:hypothetical protein FJU08_10490 [Martelella alba]|uniref:Uncharacterized protein n=1 Tax=Martelella alba TaxID=2590451 RepID=A0A506U9F1_9HYPH|nr:hypothetical protein [Martelella alba]TPW31072.1 hypothetical protein FJU08_10490 [Martelella alba]
MKNPLLSNLHDFHHRRVEATFPDLGAEKIRSASVFHKYLESRPEKFFSKSAYHALLHELRRVDNCYAKELFAYLKDHRFTIDNAFRHAQEINAFGWHDQEMKGENDYLSLILIDREVHPAYLRLVEGVFQPMLRIVAHFSRLSANKGTEGLNLYSIVAELPDHDFADVKASYVHLMRNGIAHGGIMHSGDGIIYRDSKGSELVLRPRDTLQKFDDMLDICNGLLLAYSVFAFSHKHSENFVPQNLMVEALCEETRTPYWAVTGALPSIILGDQSQLIIYCNVRTMDDLKVKFSAIQTAIQAERAAPDYDRYFISMKAKNGLPGWARFSGAELKKHRLNDDDIEQYNDALEEYLPLFLGKRHIPRIIHRMATMKYAMQVGWPVIVADYRARLGKPNLTIRNSSIHRNSWAAVLNADVVIEADGQEINQDIVRNSSRAAIKSAAKHARRQLSRFSIARYLPLDFAQIDVYCTDYRRRRLHGFGLGKDLVGTIRLQRLRRIQSPDILGATIEIWRGYRLAWNRRWLER